LQGTNLISPASSGKGGGPGHHRALCEHSSKLTVAVNKTAASTSAAVDTEVMIQYFQITHIVGIVLSWQCVESTDF
jgi:hypothetical protein